MTYILYNRTTGCYEGIPQHHTSLKVFDLNRLLSQAGDVTRRWVPQMTVHTQEKHHGESA